MEHMRTAVEAPKATRREWVGLAVIALPCMLYSMDLTVLNLAVPRLSADLRPSSAQLLWIIDIYGFLLAGSLITMGTLGDRIGRRRLLLIGAAAFGVASVLAALSTSAEMLIATRALLGVAGATLAPSTLSLIRHMFVDPSQRTAAIGIWVSSYSIGGAVGPVVGGVLLEHYWWGSVFLVGVPVMVLLLILGPLLLPEFRDPNAGRLDLISAALSLASVLAVIYGLKRMAAYGVAWPPVLYTAIGVGIGVIFVHRQRKLADPLIDLRLFRARAFNASLTTYMIGTLIGFGSFVFVAQYLQLVLGLSPLQAGLWMVPWPLAFVAGSMLTPMIVRRVRVAFVVSAGLVVSAVGFALLTRVEGGSGLAVVVIGSAVMSLGLAPVFILATDLIVGTAPPEQAGAASALSETSSELGGALGIALLGSIGTAVYRQQLAETIPNGVSTDAVALALDTLGGAVVATAQVADPLGPLLLYAAREAFAHAFQIAAGVSAATAMATAIVAAVALRDVRASQAETSG